VWVSQGHGGEKTLGTPGNLLACLDQVAESLSLNARNTKCAKAVMSRGTPRGGTTRLVALIVLVIFCKHVSQPLWIGAFAPWRNWRTAAALHPRHNPRFTGLVVLGDAH